jgi:hypothetical protein
MKPGFCPYQENITDNLNVLLEKGKQDHSLLSNRYNVDLIGFEINQAYNGVQELLWKY